MAGASPRSADLDFADVFGGPPRRSSGNERLSGRGSVDSSSIGSSAPRPWSGEGETPVFGDRGSGDRRRHLGEEFYKDIFPGSDAALPRHAGAGDWGDVFGGPPSPGSTTRPRSSFSMKFSRGAESPMPTTPSRQTSHTNHDGTSYADSVQTSPNSQMNSYLAQETPPQDSRKKPFSWRRYPFLSRLRSQSGDKSNASNQVSSMESEAEGTPVDGEGVMANNGFHFSFYKWAGKGALLVLPVTMEEKDAAIIGLKSFPKVVVQDFDLIEDGMSTATGVSKSQTDYEDSKSGKYSTNSGTKEGPMPLLFDDDYTQGMKYGTDYSADSPSANSSRRPSTERSRSRRVKEKVKDFIKIFSPQVSPKRKGAPDVQDQASNAKDKSKIELQDKFTLSSSEASEDVKTAQIDQSTFINVPSPKSERQERTEKPVLTVHTKMEGKVDPNSARNEVAPNAMKEFMKIFSPKGSPKRKVAREVEGQASSAKNEIKTELRDKFNISSSEANEDVTTTQNNQNAFISVPSPLREMQERMEKPVLTVNSKMEGKVDMTSARNEVAPNALKDFMKIFSPKGSPKRKVAQEVVDQASDAKNESETELRDKFTISSSEVSEDVKTTQNDQNAFINVPSPVSQMQERMEKPVLTVNSKMEGKMYTTSARNEAAPNELISDGRESKLDNTIHHGERYVEDFDGFLVEHISVDPVYNDEEKDQRMIAESKIREWSRGKEGNIRSLLSTLQHVLWPESGWKPIPLVDVIEGAAVKKAYQKALLCLHPDKLQQRGAAMHQKYIAEKVFDILQESWKEFNSVSFG